MNLPSSLTKPSLDPIQLDLFIKTKEDVPTSDCNRPQELPQQDAINAIQESSTPPSRMKRWRSKVLVVLKRHLAFIGPGIIASVAYSDPGNWVTDLAAGYYGYKLNFTILLAGVFGIFLQILAVRLGAVTGVDLAHNTRLLCLPEDRDGHLLTSIKWRKSRTALLWINYAVAEGALIATELAELIGSAIALNLLFPKLPVWGGVLVTSADVLVILAIIRPNSNTRVLEWLIGALVLTVIACFIALLAKVQPNMGEVFFGYVPSHTLISPGALYASIGIVGAVIMPHSLYLGSYFATIQRLPAIKEIPSEILAKTEAIPTSHADWKAKMKKAAAAIDPDLVDDGKATNTDARLEKMTIAQMKIQIPHASWDIGLSLFFFAIFVNSAILVVAGTAFYYKNGSVGQVGDLYDAFNLLKNTLGKAYAILFSIALLAAGQSASITVTIAGGLVSEGFIKWKTNLFVRRLVTRLITMVPAIAIAIAVGRNGLEETLIASQVALSFALPIVLVPLLLVTSLKSKMLVEEDVDPEAQATHEASQLTNSASASTSIAITDIAIAETAASEHALESKSPAQTPGTTEQVLEQPFLPSIQTISHDFSSPYYIIAMGIIVYTVILLADFYTLITTINPKL